MNSRNSNSQTVAIQLFVQEDCPSCRQVERDLEYYCGQRPFLELNVLDIADGHRTPNGRTVYITPALWVNGSLWSFGPLNLERFHRRLKRLMTDDAVSSRHNAGRLS